MGPRAIRPDRANYNQQIIESADEQMLLNLVRLRYRDRPMFLELQSIVTQRSLHGNLSGGAKIGVGGGSGNEGVLGASMGFEEKPTVTYAPLQGEDFARRILTPLTPETIILLSSSGWSIERLLLICVSRLNGLTNATSAAGPTPKEAPEFKEFHEIASILRRMQKEGLLTLQVFRSADEGSPRIDVMLDMPSDVAPVPDAELDQIRERLNLTTGEHQLRLTSALRPSQKNEMALTPRSLLGVLFFLSQAVAPPPEHEEQGLVTVTRDAEGNRFDWSEVTGRVFNVRSQSAKPDNASVAVRHRGYWFYVEDTDLDSKTTLNLLHFLFSLKAGGEAGSAPILTLPAG